MDKLEYEANVKNRLLDPTLDVKNQRSHSMWNYRYIHVLLIISVYVRQSVVEFSRWHSIVE